MYEKTKLFFKWFFGCCGVAIFCIIISVLAYLCGYYSSRSKTVYPPETNGIEYVIKQFEQRINQQADIIRSALAESDKLRADYKLTKQHLDQAAKRINQLTVSNDELARLNQAAGKEIRDARALLEAIGTHNITESTIIIELKNINTEIENGINNLPDCCNN